MIFVNSFSSSPASITKLHVGKSIFVQIYLLSNITKSFLLLLEVSSFQIMTVMMVIMIMIMMMMMMTTTTTTTMKMMTMMMMMMMMMI